MPIESNGFAARITDQLKQVAVSKIVSGPPQGSGSDSRYAGFASSMIVDTLQPDNGVSLFGFNGQNYYARMAVGASKPARGSVACYGGVLNVYDYADAPARKVGGEPCGFGLTLNALTAKANGSQSYWLRDMILLGPAKSDPLDREAILIGDSLAIAKLSPGHVVDMSNAAGPKIGSAGRSAQTAPGLCANVKTVAGDSWNGQTAYTIGFGHIVFGYGGPFGTARSGDHPAAIEGFAVCYQAGGWGPAYLNPGLAKPSTSKIGTGFSVQHHTVAGLHIGARHSVGTGNSLVVEAGAGPAIIDVPTSFGAGVAQHGRDPVLTLTNTAAAPGQRAWRTLASGPSWLMQTSDETGGYFTALQVDRNGPSVQRVAVGGALRLAAFTVGTMPLAAMHPGEMIWVSNARGGATLAYSDGSAWFRSADRASVS